RGAGSAYRVDGRDVRQKDVSLLFADAATGAHSPALVSQGRIGAVIAAKPTERRQMLEEAAGISGLHARRKDAEAKLRAAETNITRLDELLSDQEARAAGLRRQARAAERYRSLTDRIRGAEAKLLFARWDEAQTGARAARAEADAASFSVAKLQALMLEAQEQQEAAALELGVRRTALVEARDNGRTLAHELATARARRDTIVRRLAELERIEAAQASETAREEALRDDAARAIATLAAEREAIAARLSDGEAQAARLAADVNAAEIVSRGAEAALAGLLAREAAMRAERRVAQAALEAAEAQAARTASEASRIEAQIEALGDGNDHREALANAQQQAKDAASALADAEEALEAADAGRAQAAEQRDGAESDLASARAALAAAASERKALADALAQGSSGTVPVAAEPGYERALAAALGDDLDAAIGGDGPRRWSGSEAAGDPRLAAGLEPLSAFTTAPPELARRLAQVGVADRDDGQALQVGQRLVTRDGMMRRWDGFVASGGGAATAERLIRANRMGELERILPGLEAKVASAVEGRGSALAAVEHFRRQADDARTSSTEAERQSRDAVRAGDSATNAIERLDAQRDALTERRADLDPLIAASAASVEAAGKALGALADPAALANEIDAARDSASIAGGEVADRRAAAATRARELAADRERDAAAQREAGEWRERGRKASDRLVETAARTLALATERTEITAEPERLACEIDRIERDTAASEAAVGAAATAENEAEQAVANAALALREAGEGFAAAREERAGAVARAEAQTVRREELARECGEKFECPPPLLPGKFEFDPANLAPAEAERETFERLTAERERLGPVNLVAESELAELDANRAQGAAERDELQEAINRLRGSIGSLNREGRVRLLAAFEQVNTHFQSLFTTLFDGGQAHLELVESDDPLEAGLEILAQPPGKRLTALTLLSGGEQALTAVALIFGLFLTNPAPICVLDEVDAPLDDANVDRFCDLLDRMTAETDTRYLIVTHNAVTMARMHRLYGVTMIEQGVSRLVSVDLGGAERLLAAE
ncbi:MAG: chromosome segregation protein, partial [Sphingomicrobium sp.]